jgi:hypothetical protein
MSSKLKSDTARINGAKSHGPVTPEGRAKSSANSRTHGLAAKYTLLPKESADEFQLLFDDYIAQFQPQTAVETELVEVMVIARWRLRRLLAIETGVFEMEVSRRGKQIDREFNGLDEDSRLAWVFQKLADNGASTAMLIRYEGAINRSYDKALKQLLLLQSRRPTPPPSGPWVRSAFPDSHDPAASDRTANDPRPDDVGLAVVPTSRLSGRLGFEPRPVLLNRDRQGAAQSPTLDVTSRDQVAPVPKERGACSMLRPSIPFVRSRGKSKLWR